MKGSALILLILLIVVVGGFFTLDWAYGENTVTANKDEWTCQKSFDQINKFRYSTERPEEVIEFTDKGMCYTAFLNMLNIKDEPMKYEEFEQLFQRSCVGLCNTKGFSDAIITKSSCPPDGYPTCKCAGDYTNPASVEMQPQVTYEEFEQTIIVDACVKICKENGFEISINEEATCPKSGYPECTCKRY